ncbi:hypothetical protein NDA16_001215 [Ustilago loliicola]|nr:hypothetical protein NDA16_001215 [Ustilago loliicola]
MAAGKFGPSGSKMTMKATTAGPSSSSARAGPSRRHGDAGKGKKIDAATKDSDSEDAMDDDDQISLDEDEPDTEDEIEAAKGAGSKSKKTAKRKRRATSPTSFGSTLEGLLGIDPSTSAEALETLDEAAEAAKEDEDDNDAADDSELESPVSKKKNKSRQEVPAILSLAPHLRRSAQSTSLSARAARIALEQKRRREERSHAKDVIGGWGPPGVLPPLEDEDGNIIETYPAISAEDDAQKLQEFASQGGSQAYERKLRKVAQRGVVKLFNAIRAAQTTTEDDLEEIEKKQSAAKASSAAAKATATTAAAAGKKAGLASKDARLADLSKHNFLDLIKKSSKGSSKGSGVAAK